MRPMSFKQHGSGKGKLMRVLLSQQNILCGKVGVDEKVRVKGLIFSKTKETSENFPL